MLADMENIRNMLRTKFRNHESFVPCGLFRYNKSSRYETGVAEEIENN